MYRTPLPQCKKSPGTEETLILAYLTKFSRCQWVANFRYKVQNGIIGHIFALKTIFTIIKVKKILFCL